MNLLIKMKARVAVGNNQILGEISIVVQDAAQNISSSKNLPKNPIQC